MSPQFSLTLMCLLGLALLVALRVVVHKFDLSRRGKLIAWPLAVVVAAFASYVPIRHSAELLTGGFPFPVFLTFYSEDHTVTVGLGLLSALSWIGNSVVLHDVGRLAWGAIRRLVHPREA